MFAGPPVAVHVAPESALVYTPLPEMAAYSRPLLPGSPTRWMPGLSNASVDEISIGPSVGMIVSSDNRMHALLCHGSPLDRDRVRETHWLCLAA